MPLNVAAPFPVLPRITGVLHVDAQEASLKRVREIVAGKDAAGVSFPRARAMALLHASDFPNKHRDFEAVLEDENQPTEMRCLAAAYLGKNPSLAVPDILVRNSMTRDERVLAGVMRALGCIGDRSVLDAIAQAKRQAQGTAQAQAGFAERLIAHREGLREIALDASCTPDEFMPDPDGSHAFKIRPASDDDAELCLRSLAEQPYGIEFAEQPMYQVCCGRHTWMILFNRDFTADGSAERLQNQRAFLGTVALRDGETGLYSAMFLILTSPVADSLSLDVQVYHTGGHLAFVGTADVVGDKRIDFLMRAVRRAGGFAVLIEGTFADGRLDLHTALASNTIGRPKQQAVELSQPEWMKSGTDNI